MPNSNLRGFHNIASLLDMIYTNQSYGDRLEMEHCVSCVGHDNVDDTSVFLSFKNTLPNILGGVEYQSTTLTKYPLLECNRYDDWDVG